MYDSPLPTLRHPAEAELLQRALDGESSAVETVLGQLASPNPWLQQMMLEAVQECGRPDVWDRLLTCLALKHWPGQPDYCRRFAPEAAQRLEHAVLQLFTEDEPELLSGPVKLEVLRAALAEPERRSAAAVALGLRRSPLALDALVELVPAGEPRWRLPAARALGELGDERGAWSLAEALADDDEALHYEASHALGRMAAQAVPALLDALLHPKAHVRWHAVRILGGLGELSAAEGLANALGDDDYSVRWAAADALISLGPPAIPAMLDRLARYLPHDDSYQAAYHALHSLTGEGPSRLTPLLKALRGPSAPAEAPSVAFRLRQEWP
jgi:HEAT repeat protein